MPFQFSPYHNNLVGSISELMQQPAQAQARAAEQIGNAQANAALQSGGAWANAAQNIGQTVGSIPAQMQQAQATAQHQKLVSAQIADAQAQVSQRQAAAKKQQDIEQANAAIDAIMQKSMKPDTSTGVMSFDRSSFEQGLVSSGMGHLYPTMAETLDKLDASAAKRNAESRGMLAHTLIGIEQAGFTPSAVLSGAAFLKANNVITADHLQPVLGAITEDPSPENIKRVVSALGQSIPEYQTLKTAEEKRTADLAKTKAETSKVQAEVAGTLPASPSQAETARHNFETERIAGLNAGKADAAQQETARHNRAMEAQGDAAPTLTPDARKLVAHQFAMTGQLPPMGMGKAGAAVRTSIINEAADLYKNLDLPSQVAAFKANQGSLTKLQQQRDAIGAFEQTAQKNIDVFLTAAGRVVDTGSPLANALLRNVSGKVLGSPDQAAFDAARQVAVNEIAKITSNPTLSGTLSDSARKEVEAFNPQSATLAQSVAVMRLLKNDMQNRTGSLDDQIKAIQTRIATPPGQTPPTPKPAATPKTVSIAQVQAVAAKNGTTYLAEKARAESEGYIVR